MALLAAGSWGGGDFAGGMGTKASGGGTLGSLRVIVAAHSVSLVVLAILYGVQGGSFPHSPAALWALLAGVVAGLAIAAFYLSLARGAMGAPAAVSGLLAAAIPAAASTVLDGHPRSVQVAGFLLAGAAIWLIAAGPGTEAPGADAGSAGALGLAVLGGLGFGVYFLLLRLANPLGVLLPTMLARCGSVMACTGLLAILRRQRAQVRTPAPVPAAATATATWRWTGLNAVAFGWAMLASLLDTGGNLLFVASTRLGRLDVASVLAALYPAGTIVLAAVYLHERPAWRQIAGMGLALAAVVLVTL